MKKPNPRFRIKAEPLDANDRADVLALLADLGKVLLEAESKDLPVSNGNDRGKSPEPPARR